MREHELILDIVRERTDPAAGMPAASSRLDLVGRAARAGVDEQAVSDYLTDLVATDHLASWEHDGDLWYYPGGLERLPEPMRADAPAEQQWYCLATPARLRRVIQAEAGRDDPDKDLIGALNQTLALVKERDGDE